MPKFVTVDSALEKEVAPILDEIGINLDSVVKMTLKRIVRDRNISFLISAGEPTPAVQNHVEFSGGDPNWTSIKGADNKMTKNRAIFIFGAQGIKFNRNITFASKNRAAYNYWANPFFYSLEKDWYLILNDWIKKELHLFMIPAKAIRPENMVCRVDQQEKIDLQISYNDTTFTDTRSKISFAKYLIKTIQY